MSQAHMHQPPRPGCARPRCMPHQQMRNCATYCIGCACSPLAATSRPCPPSSRLLLFPPVLLSYLQQAACPSDVAEQRVTLTARPPLRITWERHVMRECGSWATRRWSDKGEGPPFAGPPQRVPALSNRTGLCCTRATCLGPEPMNCGILLLYDVGQAGVRHPGVLTRPSGVGWVCLRVCLRAAGYRAKKRMHRMLWRAGGGARDPAACRGRYRSR